MPPTSARPKSVKFHAESSTEAMWTYYRTLESRDAARRLVGDGVPEENFAAARDTIRQARAYFSAAQASPLLTRPVLDYYGMVSLAKLFLLFDAAHPRTLTEIEEVERKGHGLKQYDSVDPAGAFVLEASELEITCDGKAPSQKPRGIFPLLAQVVLGSDASKWLGARISIQQLFRAIPQLETLLAQITPDAGYLGAAAEHLVHQDGSVDVLVDLSVPGLRTLEDLQARAPYLETTGATVLLRESRRQGPDQAGITFPDPATAYRMATREEYATKAAALPPHLRGVRLESVLAYYMLMYGLSVVARYKPHRWAAILDGQTPMLPAIEAFVSAAERWWPNLVLNRLTNCWVRFSQPSYW